MKSFLVIMLVTTAITAVEWGCLDLVMHCTTRSVKKQIMVSPVSTPGKLAIHLNGRLFIIQSSEKEGDLCANTQTITRKTPHFDGRIYSDEVKMLNIVPDTEEENGVHHSR